MCYQSIYPHLLFSLNDSLLSSQALTKIAFFVASSLIVYSTGAKHDTRTTMTFTFGIFITVVVLSASFCALAVHTLLDPPRTKAFTAPVLFQNMVM